jgi:SAM-dependent methyltransferase
MTSELNVFNFRKKYHEFRRKLMPASKEDLHWRFDLMLSLLGEISSRLGETSSRLSSVEQDFAQRKLCKFEDLCSEESSEMAESASTPVSSPHGTGHDVPSGPVPRSDVQSRTEDFVRNAYRGLLRREADKEGLEAGVKALLNGELDHADLITSMMKSFEFNYSMENDPRIRPYLTPDVRELTNKIRASKALTDADLEIIGADFKGDPYFETHRLRFAELINFLLFFQKQRSVPLRVLECGSSLSTALIKKALPEILLSVSDFKNFEEIENAYDFPIKELVCGHYKLDFQKDDLDRLTYPGEAKFDIILVCEVIEHLLVNPVKVFRFLLKHLSDGGLIYITTPNVFQRSYLEAYKQRVNPTQIFPEEYSFEDAPHFHIREYSMSEILASVSSAGGRVAAFYFSSCWDNKSLLKNTEEHELGNMIVVVSR